MSGPCVVGYRDRVCPALGYGEARQELYRRIMGEGAFTRMPPRSAAPDQSAVGYIVIGNEIVLALCADDTDSRPLMASMGSSKCALASGSGDQIP